MHLDEFRLLTQEASYHPTDSLQYPLFASKVARKIWDEKALTWINRQIHEELDFITQVFADPSTYKWSPNTTSHQTGTQLASERTI